MGCEPDRAVAKKCFIVIAFNYINNVVALLGVVRKNFKGILAQIQVEPVNLLATLSTQGNKYGNPFRPAYGSKLFHPEGVGGN